MKEPQPQQPKSCSTTTRAAAVGGGTRHPVYHGVRKRRWGRWVSEIREPRKKSRIWLGSFPIPEMAAKAYDVAAYCLRGRKAQLNFPDEIDGLPPPSSTCTARDIQAEAAKAARSVRNRVAALDEPAAALSDSDGGGIDDFWGEIELPELKMGGGENDQPDGYGWSPMFGAPGDATWLYEDTQHQQFIS